MSESFSIRNVIRVAIVALLIGELSWFAGIARPKRSPTAGDNAAIVAERPPTSLANGSDETVPEFVSELVFYEPALKAETTVVSGTRPIETSAAERNSSVVL